MVDFLRLFSQLDFERVGFLLELFQKPEIGVILLDQFIDHSTSCIILVQRVSQFLFSVIELLSKIHNFQHA